MPHDLGKNRTAFVCPIQYKNNEDRREYLSDFGEVLAEVYDLLQ